MKPISSGRLQDGVPVLFFTWALRSLSCFEEGNFLADTLFSRFWATRFSRLVAKKLDTSDTSVSGDSSSHFPDAFLARRSDLSDLF